MPDVDRATEALGRWTAGRTTRRSLLGRAARVAVIVAGGPTLAALLTEEASARVCGQSGVSPKCDTFDCNETWGWCWYASGCCAGGELKKICDCCAPNTPNPRGYCPAGTEVLCIVESCGADPRLQTTMTNQIRTDDPVAISVAVSQARFNGKAPIAVIGDAASPLFAASATSVGRVVGGPVLLSPRDRLRDDTAEELRRLGTEFVKIVAPRVSPAVDASLTAMGVAVERIGLSREPEPFSVEVSTWSRAMTGARTAIRVLPGAYRAVSSAAALAHARRLPLVLGDGVLDEPRPLRREHTFGREETDQFALATAIADLALDLGVPAATITTASRHRDMVAAGAATMPAPLLLHTDDDLAGARPWLFAHRDDIHAAYPVGASFDNAMRYEIQSILNEFETHLLTGHAGQGLPVIPQPRDERPIGRARR